MKFTGSLLNGSRMVSVTCVPHAKINRKKKVSVPFFKIIPHPSDVGLEATGKNLEEALAAAAAGLFSLMTDLKKVKVAETRTIKTAAADLKELIVNWLNELIFLFETQHWLPKKFSSKITAVRKSRKSRKEKIGPPEISYQITSQLKGEKINPVRHQFKLEIKAATYNKLSIEKNRNFVRITVVFDV